MQPRTGDIQEFVYYLSCLHGALLHAIYEMLEHRASFLTHRYSPIALINPVQIGIQGLTKSNIKDRTVLAAICR
ncbi:MAG: hypothetical protein USCGTAYLOR_00475 [Chromatiales bacterium USCg_Taylor]|nr:MAG: hypothetical protein USCGTAYLOR_00475 [Chromatiales bacterium USCg_Taylor]